jgi:hypothetical protein
MTVAAISLYASWVSTRDLAQPWQPVGYFSPLFIVAIIFALSAVYMFTASAIGDKRWWLPGKSRVVQGVIDQQMQEIIRDIAMRGLGGASALATSYIIWDGLTLPDALEWRRNLAFLVGTAWGAHYSTTVFKDPGLPTALPNPRDTAVQVIIQPTLARLLDFITKAHSLPLDRATTLEQVATHVDWFAGKSAEVALLVSDQLLAMQQAQQRP